MATTTKHPKDMTDADVTALVERLDDAVDRGEARVVAGDVLVELRAADNPMQSLPDSICRLSRLRELHLRNNRLSRIPESIGLLQELRQLDLRGNPLVSLPASLAELPKLDKLDLRWVPDLDLPDWLERLEARGCLVYRTDRSG